MSTQGANSRNTKSSQMKSSDAHTKFTISKTKAENSRGSVKSGEDLATNIKSQRTKATSIGFDFEDDVEPMYWYSGAPPLDDRPNFAPSWFEDDNEPDICTMVGGPPAMEIEGEIGPATELPWERGDQERYPQSRKP
ncbi:hypothetical protein V866_003668 [Kwoniella sp. B9012]